jgi:putative methyltransferase (TIGR04325 family)
MKPFVPPAFTSAAQALFLGGRNYRTFAEAARDAGPGYESETLNRFRVERTKLNPGAVLLDHPAYAFLLLAAYAARSAEPHVVDFGGGCGEFAQALRRDCTRPLRCTVVEGRDLARRCNEDALFSWATWSERIPECPFDVFFSSGTLQYLEDPYRLLNAAFERAREFVVLGRNSFSERPLIRVQRTRLGSNGGGSRLPAGFDVNAIVTYVHRTLSLERVLEMASSAGWRVKFGADNNSGVLKYGDVVFGRDLLFARAS